MSSQVASFSINIKGIGEASQNISKLKNKIVDAGRSSVAFNSINTQLNHIKSNTAFSKLSASVKNVSDKASYGFRTFKKLGSSVKSIDQAAGGAGKKMFRLATGINLAGNNSSKASNKMAGFKSMLGKVAAIASIGMLVGVGFKFGKDSIQDYVNAHKQEVKLRAALDLIPSLKGKNKDKIFEDLKGVSDEIEKKGVVDGDVLLAGMAQLSTFQLDDKSLKTLSPLLADIAVSSKGLTASQEDLYSIGNLVGKVMNGQTGALSKSGIVMSAQQEAALKAASGYQRALILADILKSNVGGFNEALANTPEGKIKQIEIAFGNIKEQLGGALVPIVFRLSQLFLQNMPLIEKAIMLLVPAFDFVASGVESFVSYLQTPGVQAFATEMQALGTSIMSSLLPVLTQAGEIIMSQLVPRLLPFLSLVFQLAQILTSHLAPAFSQLIQIAGFMFAMVLDTINSKSSEVKTVMDGVGNVVRILAAVFGMVAQVIWGVVLAAFNMCISALSSFTKTIGLSGESGKKTSDTLAKAFGMIGKAIMILLQIAAPVFSFIGKIIGVVMGIPLKMTIQALLVIAKLIGKVGSFFKKLFKKEDAEEAKKSIEDVGTSVDGLNGKVGKKAGKNEQAGSKGTTSNDVQDITKNITLSGVKLDTGDLSSLLQNSENKEMKLDTTDLNSVLQSNESTNLNINQSLQDMSQNKEMDMSKMFESMNAQQTSKENIPSPQLSEILNATRSTSAEEKSILTQINQAISKGFADLSANVKATTAAVNSQNSILSSINSNVLNRFIRVDVTGPTEAAIISKITGILKNG